MMKVYTEDYEVWNNNAKLGLPPYVTCPDCSGDGRTECDHCGSEIDCELCDGDGKILTEELLDWDFYTRVRSFEEAMLERWKAGLPIIAGSLREPERIPHNPLLDILKDDDVFSPFDMSAPKIVLCIQAGG